MRMCEEGFGGFSSFESYDGERLILARIRFPSDAAAEECFHSKIRDGMDVLRRENLLDEAQTNVVGERIVGHADIDGPNSGFILSRDQNYVVEIASTSLRHALIYEKQVRKY